MDQSSQSPTFGQSISDTRVLTDAEYVDLYHRVRMAWRAYEDTRDADLHAEAMKLERQARWAKMARLNAMAAQS